MGMIGHCVPVGARPNEALASEKKMCSNTLPLPFTPRVNRSCNEIPAARLSRQYDKLSRCCVLLPYRAFDHIGHYFLRI